MNDTDRAGRIARLAALPDELAALLAELDPSRLDQSVEADPWTVRQIAHHVADSHMNAFIRTKLILTESRPTLKPYDQDAWALLPDTVSMPLDASLAILRGVHARWVAVFESLGADDWARSGMHPEYGEMSLDDILRSYAKHSDDHIDQMRRVLAAQ